MGFSLLAAVLAAATVAGPDVDVWPVSPLERIWADSIPPQEPSAVLEAEGARDEIISCQLAFRSSRARKVSVRDPAVLRDTRGTIAEEIEALDRGPLYVVQTSPPDGFEVPGRPRVANLWGIAEPGSRGLVNGRPVPNMTEKGVFYRALFLAGAQEEIVVEANKADRTAKAVRRLPPERPVPLAGAPAGE